MHHPQVTVFGYDAAATAIRKTELIKRWIIEGDLPEDLGRVGAVTRKAARIATIATRTRPEAGSQGRDESVLHRK
jgi:hypothetical protein